MPGLMVINMQADGKMVNAMEREVLSGQKVTDMKVFGKMTRFLDKGDMSILPMQNNTLSNQNQKMLNLLSMVVLRVIVKMGTEHISGSVAQNILGTLRMVKVMV